MRRVSAGAAKGHKEVKLELNRLTEIHRHGRPERLRAVFLVRFSTFIVVLSWI